MSVESSGTFRTVETNDIISLAEEFIFKEYGVRVSVRKTARPMFKYGLTSNADNGVETTIMQNLGTVVNETYATDNIIDSLSTSAAAASGVVDLWGSTISGNTLTPVYQQVTLNGQNKVSLTTPLARADRLRKPSTGVTIADGETVYVFDDTGVILTAGVPDIDAQVHIIMASTDGSSLKAALSTNNNEYLIIYHMYADVATASAAAQVDIKFKERSVAGDFITRYQRTIRTGGNSGLDFLTKGFIVSPDNCDLKLTATSDVNNITVTGGFFGYYAEVI